MQNHHIAFGGGTNTTNYRASIGMMDRKEVVQNNAYQNFTAKVNLSQKAFQDRFQLDMGLFGSLQKNNYLTDEQKTFYSAATFNPTFPNHRNPETGSWDQITNASQITNPLAWLEVQDDESNAHFNTHMKLSLLLNRHLTFSVFGSYSYNVIENSQYLPLRSGHTDKLTKGKTRQKICSGT